VNDEDSGVDEYDTQQFHETSTVPQASSWSTQNSSANDAPVAHSSANAAVMSSAGRHSIEAVEGEISGGLQQTRAAQLTARRQQSDRQDFGRLPNAGGAMNALDRVLFFIDRRVRKIISFARQVPGFDTLIVNDQICLIKRQFTIFSFGAANYY